MKRVLAIASILFAVIIVFAAFAGKSGQSSNLIIIKSIEKPSGTAMQRSVVCVYKDGNTTEQIELEDLSGKSAEKNLKLVGDLLLKYVSQGYEIVSVSGAGATNSLVFNYVLQKK